MSGASTSPMVSVFAGQQCVGFVFARGHRGFEAFNERESLGVFGRRADAIGAISASVAKNHDPAPGKKMPASVGSAPPAEGTKHGLDSFFSEKFQQPQP